MWLSPDLPEVSQIDCSFSHLSTLPCLASFNPIITRYRNSKIRFSSLGIVFSWETSLTQIVHCKQRVLPEDGGASWKNTNEVPSSPFFWMVHSWKGLGRKSQAFAWGTGGKEAGGRYMPDLVWRPLSEMWVWLSTPAWFAGQ